MLLIPFLVPFILTGFLVVKVGGAEDCRSRDYGNGGTVCVCTSHHCDTLPRPEKPQPPHYLVYTSNKAGLRFRKTTGAFTTPNGTHHNQVTINAREKFQKILGFGGAFTDATGINIKSLNPQARENLLKSYFSDDGIEYSLCRVPMGGTDFSTRGYTYHDGHNFQLTPEDYLYKIPYIKEAQNLTSSNLRLVASAWTAPKWMKSNGEYSGFGFLLKNKYQTWADYFVKFLDSYQNEGIEFWGITTSNEPILPFFPSLRINSMGWTPSHLGNWIGRNLGPTIRNSSHSRIKIMVLDGIRFFLPWFVRIALRDSTTRQYIDGIAVHGYYKELFPPKRLTKTHERFPEKFILSTENSLGNRRADKHVDLGSWDRGEQYASDIIEEVSHWVGGWIDWNMAVDLTGGPTYVNHFVDSTIIVNASAGEFYKQPMFYNFGHFSKFVPRGSVRIYSDGFDSEVSVVAFQRPDNGTVVVILNKREDIVPVTLIDGSRATPEMELSARSITTILFW